MSQTSKLRARQISIVSIDIVLHGQRIVIRFFVGKDGSSRNYVRSAKATVFADLCSGSANGATPFITVVSEVIDL